MDIHGGARLRSILRMIGKMARLEMKDSKMEKMRER